MTADRGQIPLAARPVLGEAEEQAVIEVLRSGPALARTARSPRSRHAFAGAVGARHASAVSSGTAALHLALRAVGVEDGDEVVTSPFSFVASANAIVFERAKPVFADIDPVTLNLDPDAAAAAITGRTTALLPVAHLRLPGRHPGVRAPRPADRRGRVRGARRGRTPTAPRSAAAAIRPTFAFYANKQLTTGEGGMLTMGSAEHKERVDSERNQGRAPNMDWLDHDRLGLQLPADRHRVRDRPGAARPARRHARRPRARGRRCTARRWPASTVTLPCEDADGNVRGWFVFVVQLPHGIDRDDTIGALRERGVQSKPYLPAIHLMSFYREPSATARASSRSCEDVAARSVALPFFPQMTEGQVARVAEALRRRDGSALR